ncbi:MAG: hypothetical protein DI538_21580 [Azospira oryzae]|jgi:hypothetical protein|nr:MAG: hypothetical protein DI538_21580 [Azospira oryzae]
MKTANNLKKADALVKVITALCIVLLYLTGMITGGAALFLCALSLITLLLFIIRTLFHAPFD